MASIRRIPLSDVKSNPKAVLDVLRTGERVILTLLGQDVVALVSVADLDRLESEDALRGRGG